MPTMSAVSISALGNLRPADPLDVDLYVESRGFQLPPAGEYTVRAPEFTEASFSSTRNGDLKAAVDPTIIAGPFEGVVLRYTNVSAKVYEAKGKPTSQIGQYLKATGTTGTIPGDPQEQADLICQTAGRVYKVYADWEATHRATGFQVKGMKNFPVLPDGTHQSWVEHPDPSVINPETGERLRLRANLVVKQFRAPVQ